MCLIFIYLYAQLPYLWCSKALYCVEKLRHVLDTGGIKIGREATQYSHASVCCNKFCCHHGRLRMNNRNATVASCRMLELKDEICKSRRGKQISLEIFRLNIDIWKVVYDDQSWLNIEWWRYCGEICPVWKGDCNMNVDIQCCILNVFHISTTITRGMLRV